MKNEIKSGKEILDDFFSELPKDASLDKTIIAALVDLYNDGNLSERNIVNMLNQLREDGENDKD
jgi:hypothetical protein